MTKFSIAICDDLTEERVGLAKMVAGYCARCGLNAKLRLFSSGGELLSAFSRPRQFQMIFLDIYMEGMSGTETARRIRGVDRDVPILFATTSRDHGLASFSVQACDYLVKPIRPDDVARAMDWCLEHIPEPLRCLTVLTEGERVEIPLSEIRYIDVRGHQSCIHTVTDRSVVTRRGLDELESAIDSREFLRCHRSALVNMNHIQGLEGNDFRMSDQYLVPISSANATQIRSRFIDWTYYKAWGET